MPAGRCALPRSKTALVFSGLLAPPGLDIVRVETANVDADVFAIKPATGEVQIKVLDGRVIDSAPERPC